MAGGRTFCLAVKIVMSGKWVTVKKAEVPTERSWKRSP